MLSRFGFLSESAFLTAKAKREINFCSQGLVFSHGEEDNPSRGGNHGRPGTSRPNKTPTQDDQNGKDTETETQIYKEEEKHNSHTQLFGGEL